MIFLNFKMLREQLFQNSEPELFHSRVYNMYTCIVYIYHIYFYKLREIYVK